MSVGQTKSRTRWSRPRVRAALDRRMRRLRKYVLQAPRRRADRDRHGVFIVGCQRSGTTMLADAFDRSSSTWVYQEYARRAFHDFRLRDADTIRRLIRRSPASVTVFKPICDSHLTDCLLEDQPGSQATWIYRYHADVARSAVAKWGDHQLDVVTAIVDGRATEVGWRGERIAAPTLELLQDLSRARSENAANAGAMLFWALRNRIYFDLGLDRDERVRLLSYDHLVEHPQEVLTDVLGFTDSRVDPATFAHIDARSASRRPIEGVAPEIVEACDRLLEQLEATRPAAHA